jgi:hypothetical protein
MSDGPAQHNDRDDDSNDHSDDDDSTATLHPGDRIAAVRDLETTQLLHIPQGAEGTVAEDRGSKLVVYFDDETAATNMEEKDLRRLRADDDPSS